MKWVVIALGIFLSFAGDTEVVRWIGVAITCMGALKD